MRCQAQILAHSGWIRCLQLNERTAMTGSSDNTIKLWDLSLIPNMPTYTSIAPSDPLHSYPTVKTFNEDKTSKLKSSVSTDDAWNEQDTTILRQIYSGHHGAVSCLMFDASRLVSGSTDKTIRQWDIETGECVAVLRSEKWASEEQPSVDLAPRSFPSVSDFNGGWSQDWFHGPAQQVPFWSTGYASSNSVAGHVNAPLTMNAGPSSMHSSGLNGPENGYRIYHAGGSVGALQFRGHGLAAGYGDGVIRLWDLRSGRCHRTLEGHLAPVTALGFDDLNIISGSMDRTVKIWDLRTGSMLSEVVMKHGVSNLSFDSKRIVIAAGSKEASVYLRTSGTVKDLANGHTKAVRSVAYVEDWAVSGGMDGLIHVWQL